MNLRRTFLAGLLTFALIASGCSGDDDDGGGTGPRGEEPVNVDDLDEAHQEIVRTAETWLDEEPDLDAEVRDSLRFVSIDESPSVTSVGFAQFFDDHEVVDAGISVHVLDGGEIQGATDNTLDAQPADDESSDITEDEAIENAEKAITGTADEVLGSDEVWVQNGEELQLAWRVTLTTTDPTGHWQVLIDAGTGSVVDADRVDQGHGGSLPTEVGGGTQAHFVDPGAKFATAAQDDGEQCDVPDAPSACLFIPDPIYASGGEITTDDAENANEVLQGEELQGLEDPDSGELRGEFVDAEPEGAPLDSPDEDDGTWAQGRAEPGFETAMAYYWIDYTQRLIQELGFTDVLDEPFPVVPVDPDTVDNAFYDGTQIVMGVGSDGINESEDASGIIHEYGHAVLDEQNPSLFSGGNDAGAYHEAFGDLQAWLATLEFRDGDSACLFAWAEEDQCLRRMDEDKVYPADLVQEVHEDGEIYTGAVFDVTEALLAADDLSVEDCAGGEACNEVRDRVLATLLASHQYLTPDMSLPDAASAFLMANEAEFDGADEEAITEAFDAHGLSGGGQDTMDPNGDLPGEPAEPADPSAPSTTIPGTTQPGSTAASVEFDIEHTYRGDLDVFVSVVDSDGAQLCEPVTIHEPDEADGAQDLSGAVDVSDSDCAELLPPSEDQVWVLGVRDTLPADEGQINGFTVYDGENPYRAGGLPVPIADNDPEGSFAVVDGTGEGDTEQPGDDGGVEDEVEGDGPVASIDIEHPYTGDLFVRIGAADTEGNIACAVSVHEPQAGEVGDGSISGDIDLSRCADQYPPSDETRWFLEVIDVGQEDEGSVDAFSLTGPDGETFEFGDTPVDIPDNDDEGVVLLLDGSEGGGSTGDSPAGEDPEVSVEIDHPYAGDLAVSVDVLDLEGEVQCEVVLATPDPSNDEDGLTLTESVADCGRFYPPSEENIWVLYVADALQEDVGEITSVELTGPDGAVYSPADVSGEIPDADPEGVVLDFGVEPR